MQAFALLSLALSNPPALTPRGTAFTIAGRAFRPRRIVSMAEGDGRGVRPDLTPSAPPASATPFLAATLLVAETLPSAAWAKDGQFGLLEKKLPALVHPAIMVTVFGVALGAAYTGVQWRRLRGITAQINDLKAEKKPLDEQIQAAEGDPPAGVSARVAALSADIDSLSATRSSLQQANLRDTHWALGSVLLGVGTSIAIEGPVNTFMRAGKLFPGPHLYAGAGCVVCWALAASLIQSMQKGNENARVAHIALNTLGLGLFAWQLPTGFDIVGKVWTKVPW